MMTATIYSANGAALTEGLDSAARSDQAIQAAREFARERGETVLLHDPDGYQHPYQHVSPDGTLTPALDVVDEPDGC